MYYNSLVGGVIEDPNLAGPSGSLSNPASLANVGYLQGALSAEIAHANLLRSLTGGTSAAKGSRADVLFSNGNVRQSEQFSANPDRARRRIRWGVFDGGSRVQPDGGAGLNRTNASRRIRAANRTSIPSWHISRKSRRRSKEWKASTGRWRARLPGISPGNTVFAGINLFPADNLTYEQTDGLTAVYNGTTSAVAALTPFITPGSGKMAFSFG